MKGKLRAPVGSKFGMLTVIDLIPTPLGKKSNRRVRVRCDCGTIKDIAAYQLTSGRTKSCGCYRRMKAITHGETRQKKHTPEYNAWCNMITRCTNPRRDVWHLYGGRGISVCERWTKSYEAFLQDVGRRPSPKHSLDRKNVDGNYEPGNVRWATPEQQRANQRRLIIRDFPPGIYKTKFGTYRAQANINKKCTQLGSFKTLQEAIDARTKALKEQQ